MTCCFVASPKPQCEGSICLSSMMIIFSALCSIWYVIYTMSKSLMLSEEEQNKTTVVFGPREEKQYVCQSINQFRKQN